MDYRQWKEMSKTCAYRKAGGAAKSKASSRGTKGSYCTKTGKRCKMSGCPQKKGV